MKRCRNCNIEVPPTFARALIDNKCPACGKEIMSGKDFSELRQARKMLEGMQLDDKLLVTIAAAISSKFDLVPKGERKQESEVVVVAEVEDAMAGMTEEQKVRERALQAAQKQREKEEDDKAVAEWGLDKAPIGSVDFKKVAKRAPPPQELVELFEEDIMPMDDMPPEGFVSNNSQKNAERMARLAKAEALRSNNSQFKVNRSE